MCAWRSSSVHRPCSGWSAKAGLLMASQAASSRPGWNGRVTTGRALATVVGGEGEGDAHLQQVPLGHEAEGVRRGVIGGRWPA